MAGVRHSMRSGGALTDGRRRPVQVGRSRRADGVGGGRGRAARAGSGVQARGRNVEARERRGRAERAPRHGAPRTARRPRSRQAKREGQGRAGRRAGAGGGTLNRWKRPPRGHGKFGVAAKIERTHRGEVYASKAEAAYAAQLDVRQKAGQLREWKRAPRLPLVVNGLVVGHYRPDFEVTMPDGLVTFVEVKGAWNEADRLRVRLAFACYKSLRLLCVRRRPGG